MSSDKPQFVIIHGTGGSPQGNWFPWLSSELSKLGAEAVVPEFPLNDQQNLDNWLGAFNRSVGLLNSRHVLIGHSIGAAFVLRLLERAELQIAGAVLVAPFARQLGNPEFDPFNETFVGPVFDWQRVRQGAREFLVYSGDNDPYVQLDLGREVADSLGVDLSVVKSGGHLNTSAGFLKFDRLLSDLRTAFRF